MKCMLCRLRDQEIKNELVYEDEFVYAYKDWAPWASIHVIAFPKEHVGLKDKTESRFQEAVSRLEERLTAIEEAAGMKKVLKIIRLDLEEHIAQNQEHFHYHILGSEDPDAPEVTIR